MLRVGNGGETYQATGTGEGADADKCWVENKMKTAAVHNGNIFEYSILWSEFQFLKAKMTLLILWFENPNSIGIHSRVLASNWKNVDFTV